MFKRVLIANRGEIAIRIARAAASLGVDSVAIFTPADSHVAAHQARGLGARDRQRRCRCAAISTSRRSSPRPRPAAAIASIRATASCRRTPSSPSAAQAEGLRFIGPSPDSLKLFGDKVAARAFAQAQGIPVIPGAPASSPRATRPRRRRKSIGYPVMLKASAGGGGRGMRAVTRPEEMDEAFARCQGEAEAAFGDRALFLEKIVPRPRHIEVQVLGDGQGNVVHLFERDCSVQLRNQKVVEVAPAPNLDAGLRQRILADAVKLARAAQLRECRHGRVPGRPRDRRALLHRVQSAHPGRAHHHRAGHGLRPGRGAVPHRRRRVARRARARRPEGGRHAARLCRAGARRGAGHRHAQRLPRAVRPRRARRCLRLCRAGAAAAVRSPAGQADLPVRLLGLASTRPSTARAARSTSSTSSACRPTCDQLRAILAHPEFRAGNARTTLLAEAIEPAKAKQAALQFLDQQVASLGRGRGASAATGPAPAGAARARGHREPACGLGRRHQGARRRRGEGRRPAVRRQRHEDGDLRRGALRRRRRQRWRRCRPATPSTAARSSP